MKSNVISVNYITPTIAKVSFQKPLNYSYIAGQFIELTIPTLKSDNKRWFTLSSSPYENYLSITTKVVRPKTSSYKKSLRSLSDNSVINISEPMGDFVLPVNPDKQLLFVSIGMGVTPFISIINQLKAKNKQHKISLMQAAQSYEELLSHNVFNSFCWRYTPYLANPSSKIKHKLSKISPTDIAREYENLNNPLVYLSGPESVLKNIKNQLLKQNISGNHIITDYFPGYDTD